MQQKPMNQRLEDIERKLEDLIEINKTSIESSTSFSSDLDKIKRTINKEVKSSILEAKVVSAEWEEVITYCSIKNISPTRAHMMLRILKGDTDNFYPKDEKEREFWDYVNR